MNFHNAPRTHRRALLALGKEAVKIGGNTLETQTLGGTSASAVGDALRILTRRHLSATALYLTRLQVSGRDIVCIDPFDGNVGLPGEFRCDLPGVLPSALVYGREGALGGARWQGKDSSTIQGLSSDPSLKRALRKLSWEKQSGGRIHLDWAVQVCSLDGETTAIVMQTGSYQGLIGPKAGLAVFLSIVDALAPLLETATTIPQSFPLATLTDHLAPV